MRLVRVATVLVVLWSAVVAANAREVSSSNGASDQALDVRSLVEKAVDQNRGLSSFARMTMTVQRPSWSRTSTLDAWTRGREDALIRFTAPARDAGNATLKQGEKMWTFTPKLNRTVRLPFSLMSQSWAGSDFSYNDLSRSDELLRHYTLELISTEQDGEHTIYTIDALPLVDAPVVWGKERIVLRDDYVMIEQVFYDQDLQPLKRMEALEIQPMGGRTVASKVRMFEVATPDSFTELVWENAEFDIELEDKLFTLFSLRQGNR